MSHHLPRLQDSTASALMIRTDRMRQDPRVVAMFERVRGKILRRIRELINTLPAQGEESVAIMRGFRYGTFYGWSAVVLTALDDALFVETDIEFPGPFGTTMGAKSDIRAQLAQNPRGLVNLVVMGQA